MQLFYKSKGFILWSTQMFSVRPNFPYTTKHTGRCKIFFQIHFQPKQTQPKKWGTKLEIGPKCKDQKCIYFGQNILKKKILKKLLKKLTECLKEHIVNIYYNDGIYCWHMAKKWTCTNNCLPHNIIFTFLIFFFF